MNNLHIALTFVLCFALFFTGYATRDLEGKYVADRTLTTQVQDTHEKMNGLAVQLRTCEWKSGINKEVNLEVQNVIKD